MRTDISSFLENSTVASSTQRFKAGFIDGLIQVTVFLACIPFFNRILAPYDLASVTIVPVMILILSFEAIQVSLWGQTLGHRLYDIEVVDVDGLRPSFSTALKRWLFKVLYGIRTFDAMNQGMSRIAIHDQNTGTFVIQRG